MQPIENIPPNRQDFGTPQKPIDHPINSSVPNLLATNPNQSKFHQIEESIGREKGGQLLSKAAKSGFESLRSQVVEPLIQKSNKGMHQTIKGVISSIDLMGNSITIRGRSGQSMVVYFSGSTQVHMQGKLSSLSDLSLNDKISIEGTEQEENVFIAKQVINLPDTVQTSFDPTETPDSDQHPINIKPIHGNVSSVNLANQTVTVQYPNGQLHTISIIDQTQLVVNGETKRLEDLVPGDQLTVQGMTIPIDQPPFPASQKMRGVVIGQDPLAQTVTIQSTDGRTLVVRMINETQFIDGERLHSLEQLTIGSVLALIVTKQAEDLFVARKVVNLSQQNQQEQVLNTKNEPVGIYLADPEKKVNAARLHRVKGIIISVNLDNGVMAVHGLDGIKHQVIITNNTWIVINGQSKSFEHLTPGSLVAAIGILQNDDSLIARKIKAN